MLAPGTAKSAIIIGAGASGLMCARLLQRKGLTVTIIEGRDRIGGRLYTDSDGLDIGGHWIHGGGPDPDVADYAASTMETHEINPVRQLCDELGIATWLTDGDSAYIGESEAGVREIAFYSPDGKLMEDDGEAETELWDVYELVMGKVHDLEASMIKAGKAEGDMSLADAINEVTASLDPPLTARQRRFLQWHLETELGGDYAEDAQNLSFFHYDGGCGGPYRIFPGGDRVLDGGYSRLINKLAEPLLGCIQMNTSVTSIERGRDGGDGDGGEASGGVTVTCADGCALTADVAVITLPLGVLQRKEGEAGHVEITPPLPEWKAGAISRGRMACLNKLFLIFDECHWPREQYTFAYINETADEYPSMLVNVWPSHKLPILTCLVGGGAGRAMERRSLDENVAWAMRLVRKLFGESVPLPSKAVQTGWDQDPFSYGAYSCAGKGIRADDQLLMGEPVGGNLFFAGEHTNPLFWGCVHGALVSAYREAARITGDETLMSEGGIAVGVSFGKRRDAKDRKIKDKIAAVKVKAATRIEPSVT